MNLGYIIQIATMYLSAARLYTCKGALDQPTKNKINEILIQVKTLKQWHNYSRQRKFIRRGLFIWKKNAATRKQLRTKYNRIFLMIVVLFKWKNYVLLRKNLRTVVTQLESTICSICFSDFPNFISRCKHTFCKRCISKWLSIKTTCAICRSSEITNDVSLPFTIEDTQDEFDFLTTSIQRSHNPYDLRIHNARITALDAGMIQVVIINNSLMPRIAVSDILAQAIARYHKVFSRITCVWGSRDNDFDWKKLDLVMRRRTSADSSSFVTPTIINDFSMVTN